MEWYWWVLIVVAVIAWGYIKIKFVGKWMEKRRQQQDNIPEDE